MEMLPRAERAPRERERVCQGERSETEMTTPAAVSKASGSLGSPPGRYPSSPNGSALREYVRQHAVEPVLAEALKAACDEDAADPIRFIGEFMLSKSSKRATIPAEGKDHASPETQPSSPKDDISVYTLQSAFEVARTVIESTRESIHWPCQALSARQAAMASSMNLTSAFCRSQRTLWLLFFLFGLLLCARVMHQFEELLAQELELAFFVPLLIGAGGNSGGQTVSTVIRALGSGSVSIRDAPRVILKEGIAGLLQVCSEALDFAFSDAWHAPAERSSTSNMTGKLLMYAQCTCKHQTRDTKRSSDATAWLHCAVRSTVECTRSVASFRNGHLGECHSHRLHHASLSRIVRAFSPTASILSARLRATSTSPVWFGHRYEPLSKG